MKFDRYSASAKFADEDGCGSLTVRYTNRGEPYREGASFSLHDDCRNIDVDLMLEKAELLKLRNLIDQLYPRLDGGPHDR